MKDHPSIPCPAEKYGVDLVAETVTRVYETQEQCAESHACPKGAVCLLEGYWPEEQGDTADESAASGGGESPIMACCGCSSWEFLGSD